MSKEIHLSQEQLKELAKLVPPARRGPRGQRGPHTIGEKGDKGDLGKTGPRGKSLDPNTHPSFEDIDRAINRKFRFGTKEDPPTDAKEGDFYIQVRM